jgi:hypothetical protein
MKFVGFIALGLLLFTACKKETTSDSINFHADYYPLETGRFVIYEAMEIQHDDQAIILSDTNKFFLKTVIGEEIEDLMGDQAHKFYRYTRTNENDPWVIKDVWTTKLKSNRVELVEENERIVKLVFAPTPDKEWDMNAYNAEDKMLVRYDETSLHKSYTSTPSNFPATSLDSTIRVNQQNFFSLVDDRKKYEIYAKGIGLVHKFYKNNSINNFDTLNIRQGREIHYRLIEFGKE